VSWQTPKPLSRQILKYNPSNFASAHKMTVYVSVETIEQEYSFWGMNFARYKKKLEGPF